MLIFGVPECRAMNTGEVIEDFGFEEHGCDYYWRKLPKRQRNIRTTCYYYDDSSENTTANGDSGEDTTATGGSSGGAMVTNASLASPAAVNPRNEK